MLIMKSGSLCGMCRTALVSKGIESDKPVAEMAHIQGDKEGSARYNADMSDEDRNSYKNLFLLCPTCHTKIDKDEQTYTTEWLYAKKEAHEAEVEKQLKQLTLEVSYFELQHTLQYLVTLDYTAPPETLDVIPPKDKIQKNGLSPAVEGYLQVGLLQNSQIEEFLNKNSNMDYAAKVRSYFVAKYIELKESGLSGDGLFYALWSVISNGNSEAKYCASALSVLAYYFYLCEVFER